MMSQRYIRVSELIKETEREVQKRSEPAYNTAAHLKWEGIPVSAQVHSFLTKLLTTYKHYKVGVTDDLGMMWHVDAAGNSDRVFSEVWLYVPSERYARGRIGYGEFFATKNGETYMVYNHTIHNNKYNSHREHYHMMLTSKEDAALKLAYKHIKPLGLMDIVHRENHEFLVSMRRTADNKEREADNLFREKIKDNAVIELRHALNAGHKFSSEDFKQNLIDFFGKHDEFKAYKSKARSACYVLIRPGEYVSEQMADILTCAVNCQMNFKSENAVTVKMSDIPVDIAGKIAVLSMVNDGHYVEGVGQKVSDDAYWIERD